MGIFDIFRKNDELENIVRVTYIDPDTGKTIWSMPVYHPKSGIHHYLIEIRFSGFAKESIRELKTSISRNFGVTKWKIVPHITLVGPLSTSNEKLLVKTVRDVCKKYDLVKFSLDGFDNFENNVIYVRIKPSEELKNLRAELAQKLAEFC
jgi:2'-5' RNA ligase